MAHDVFVSHSSKDKLTADAVCAVLEAKGIRCWVAPRDVIPGSDWGESIIDAINGARVMVLIFSGHANDSPQIKREVERAVTKGLAIIPMRIEEIVPTKSLEYFISNAHWLDAFSPPLERHLEYLCTIIGQVLKRPLKESSVSMSAGRLSASMGHEKETHLEEKKARTPVEKTAAASDSEFGGRRPQTESEGPRGMGGQAGPRKSRIPLYAGWPTGILVLMGLGYYFATSPKQAKPQHVAEEQNPLMQTSVIPTPAKQSPPSQGTSTLVSESIEAKKPPTPENRDQENQKSADIQLERDFVDDAFAKAWSNEADGAFAVLESFKGVCSYVSIAVRDTEADLTARYTGEADLGEFAIIGCLKRSEAARELGWNQFHTVEIRRAPGQESGSEWTVRLTRPSWTKTHTLLPWNNDSLVHSQRVFSITAIVAALAESKLTKDVGLSADRLINPEDSAKNLQTLYKLEADSGIRLKDARQLPIEIPPKNASGVASVSAVPFSVSAEGSYPEILDFIQRFQKQSGWVVQIRNLSIKENPNEISATPDTQKSGASLTPDQQLLEEIAAKVQPSGSLYVAGKPLLMFGKRFVKVGAHFTVTYKGKDYDFELSRIDGSSFTMSYNGEEVTRPLPPVNSPQTSN